MCFLQERDYKYRRMTAISQSIDSPHYGDHKFQRMESVDHKHQRMASVDHKYQRMASVDHKYQRMASVDHKHKRTGSVVHNHKHQRTGSVDRRSIVAPLERTKVSGD